MLPKYSLQHLLACRMKNLIAVLTVAAVVIVFVVVMALAEGLRSTFNHTGDPLDLMVLHKGSLGDMSRGLDPDVVNIIKELPGIDTDREGRLMVSPEQYVIVYLTRRESDQGANIMVRGVPPVGFSLRSRLQLVEGRLFRPGAHEVIVSKYVSSRYRNASIGDQIRLGRSDWTVVGVFDGGESIINTEIWADVDEVTSEFGRASFYSLILARAVDMNALRVMIDRMKSDPRVNLRAVSQNQYAIERGRISRVLRVVALILTLTLSIGAMFVMLFVRDDALISRAKEVAMLRVIGFRPGRIFLSILGESLILAFVGGLLGALISSVVNNMSAGAPFMIYREIGFHAQVTPGLVISGLIIAVAIGLAGGLLPAYRAARQHALAATR